jgi:hypothetical protein
LKGRDPKEGLQTQKETSGIASSSVFLVKDGLRGIVANLGAILEARICEDKVETEELCGGGKMMRKKLKDSDRRVSFERVLQRQWSCGMVLP